MIVPDSIAVLLLVKADVGEVLINNKEYSISIRIQ